MSKTHSNIRQFSRITPANPVVCIRINATIYMQLLSEVAKSCDLPKSQILACCDGKLRDIGGIRFCYPHSPETAFDASEPVPYGQTMDDVRLLIGEMYEKLTDLSIGDDAVYGTWETVPEEEVAP